MNFNFILTLEEQALLKVADTFWTGESIEKLLLNIRNFVYEEGVGETWLKRVRELIADITSNTLSKRISSMVIPETLKRKLVCITRRVGLQKVDWYFYHEQLWDIRKLPNRFYWTAQGCIDRRTTAEVLVKDVTIDICDRYAVACFYCIENQIRALDGGNHQRCEKCLTKCGNELRNFWNSIIKQEQRNGAGFSETEQSDEDCRLGENEHIQTYRDAYRYSLENANTVAAEYFLEKVTLLEYNVCERDEDSMYFFQNMLANYFTSSDKLQTSEQYLDVVFHLLKRMNKDQQIQAFRDYYPNKIFMFTILLSWPFHSLFLQTIETFRHYISQPDGTLILRIILKKDIEIFEDLMCRDLFTEVWQILPLSVKADIIDFAGNCTWLFSCFLEEKHMTGLFRVLEDATASQKEELILKEEGMKTCETFAVNGEWDLLKLFVNSCLPSRSTASIMKFDKTLKSSLPKDTVSTILKVLEIENCGT